MHFRLKVLVFAALSFFASVSGAFAIPLDYDGPTYYQGSREQLREMCRTINGELYETAGKTRCYSIHRQSLYICKSSGLCQIQRWSGDGGGSPMATGGGGYEDDGFGDSLTGGSDSGTDVIAGGGMGSADDGSDGSGDNGSGGDGSNSGGDIIL
jgi:hypothetical protein